MTWPSDADSVSVKIWVWPSDADSVRLLWSQFEYHRATRTRWEWSNCNVRLPERWGLGWGDAISIWVWPSDADSVVYVIIRSVRIAVIICEIVESTEHSIESVRASERVCEWGQRIVKVENALVDTICLGNEKSQRLQLKPNVLSSYKSFCNVMKILFVGNNGAVAWQRWMEMESSTFQNRKLRNLNRMVRIMALLRERRELMDLRSFKIIW